MLHTFEVFYERNGSTHTRLFQSYEPDTEVAAEQFESEHPGTVVLEVRRKEQNAT